MNKNELHGGARYVGGKVEKGIGDVVESREWQADGVVDQVAGGAEHLYGRAKSIGSDAMDAAPGLIDDAREKVEDAAHRAGKAAQRGSETAVRTVNNNPAIWAAVAAIAGYGLAWLIHGRD